MKDKKNKAKISSYLYILLILAIIFSIINLFLIQGRFGKLKEAKEILKEKLRPASLEIIKITFPCSDCFDIENAISELKKQNVNVTKEETFDFNNAKELINKYNIKKLPTLIISGEVNKSEQLSDYFKKVGDIKDNVVIYKAIKPPYFDNLLNEVVGRVELINIVDSSCKECTSLGHITTGLKQAGIVVTNEKIVQYNSIEGQELINKFRVRQVPAMLISKEIDYYDAFKQEKPKLNLTEKEGFYALHSIVPPYRDLSENKMAGLVDVILLVDNSCSTCYNVSINTFVLKRFGIYVNSENTYDINSKEGKELINKYKIKKVPILIINPEINAYASFIRPWSSVGSIESDGWFIMRKPEVLGTYRDLETGEITSKVIQVPVQQNN